MIGSAILLLVLGQSPASLAGTALDPDGRPLAGVEILLAQGLAPDGTVPVLARATTDDQGRYRLREPDLARRRMAFRPIFIFAYRPGLGMVARATDLKRDDPAADRLGFDAAGRRSLTLGDGNGHPLAGVRLAPVQVISVSRGFGRLVTIPDELADRLAATTGPDGRAELACLAPTAELVALRVTVPGGATQAVALPKDRFKSEAIALELKPGGRLVGRVRHHDGRPVAGALVKITSQSQAIPIRFEAGPVRTEADGSFRTPPGLLAGVEYRVTIRADEPYFVPTVTATLAGGPDRETELPEFVLTPLRSLAGRAVDRQGRPVAGAEVVAVARVGVSATTDAQGRFRIERMLPDARALLVVRHEGFHIDGRWLGERDEEVEVVLTRLDEPPRQQMTTQPGLLSAEERRRLARRVLEPYLSKALAQGTDSEKYKALHCLVAIDPAAALEELERTTFERREKWQGVLRSEIAKELARDDPEEAATVAEGIADPSYRSFALLGLSDLPPDGQRARKLELLERALLSARAVVDPSRRLALIADTAARQLDAGEAGRAKALSAEIREGVEKLSAKKDLYRNATLIRLGRLDPPAALALVERDTAGDDRAVVLGNIAARLAASDPAEAERLLGRIKGLPIRYGVTLRAGRAMARSDLPRARRIALAQDDTASRVAALIFVAYGLPASERTAARDLIRQALAEVDRPQGTRPTKASYLPPLLPLVEAVDPALVPELFWRALADPAPVVYPTKRLLLARYDRRVAAALLEPAGKARDAQGPGAPRLRPASLFIIAQAILDPRRAAEEALAMPEPASLDPDADTNAARLALSEFLGRDPDGQWSYLWDHYSGLRVILSRDDILH